MPITFDDAAAEELVAQLDATARSLAELLAQFEHEIVAATEDWEGRFRNSFDAESLRHDLTARALANELHLMAVAVRAKLFEAQAARRAEALAAEQARQVAQAAANAAAARQSQTMPPTGTVPWTPTASR